MICGELGVATLKLTLYAESFLAVCLSADCSVESEVTVVGAAKHSKCGELGIAWDKVCYKRLIVFCMLVREVGCITGVNARAWVRASLLPSHKNTHKGVAAAATGGSSMQPRPTGWRRHCCSGTRLASRSRQRPSRAWTRSSHGATPAAVLPQT